MTFQYDPTMPDCPRCGGPRFIVPCDRDEGGPLLLCDRCEEAVELGQPYEPAEIVASTRDSAVQMRTMSDTEMDDAGRHRGTWLDRPRCYCGGPEEVLYGHLAGTGYYCRREVAS